MSKIDVITRSVIELDRVINSLVGFKDLIPEGADDDCFNLFVPSSLEKLEIDLRKVVDDVRNSI